MMKVAWVLAVVGIVGVAALGVLVLQGDEQDPFHHVLECETTVSMVNGTYCIAETDIPPCDAPIRSNTPYVVIHIGDSSFSMRVGRCLTPGGHSPNGTYASPNGTSSPFKLLSRSYHDESGWITWYSTDPEAVVQWDGAYHVQVLVRADEVTR
jgi:hypothetical protein